MHWQREHLRLRGVDGAAIEKHWENLSDRFEKRLGVTSGLPAKNDASARRTKRFAYD